MSEIGFILKGFWTNTLVRKFCLILLLGFGFGQIDAIKDY